MPATPGSRRQASLLEGLRGLVDMGASTLRGGVASTLGAPGDIEAIVRKLRGNEEESVFPTTERMGELLPQTGNKGFKAYESVGEYANPLTPAKKAVALSGALAPAGKVVGAMFVPALKLADKPKQQERIINQLNAGATPKELWKEHQVAVAPTRPKDDPSTMKLLEEINDKDVKFKKDIPMMSQVDKSRYVRENFSPLQYAGAMQRIVGMQMPKPGMYTQEDLLDHPELFEMFPHLRKGTVKVVDKADDSHRGSFSPETGDIELNLPRFMDTPNPGGGVVGTNIHELTHRLQNDYDLPGGSNQAFYQHPKQLYEQVGKAAEDPEFQKKLGPQGMAHLLALLRYKDVPKHVPYVNAPGEKFATAAQTRFGYGNETRKAMNPYDDELAGIYDEPDPMFAHGILQGTKSLSDLGYGGNLLPDYLRKQWGLLK
jgi:hypothetical protein